MNARPWAGWLAHFERNADRSLPAIDRIDATDLAPAIARRVARSLAVFQRGESGEGRIAKEIHRAAIDGIDADYRRAIELFIAEEGRHARILAEAVRALGGRTVTSTWTDRLFVRGRRLAGVRLKLLVLLAAEIVGITFYGVIAQALPPSAIRLALEEIVRDEERHLEFHAAFFRSQVTSRARAACFGALWFAISRAARWTVLLDHRRTLYALRIPIAEVDRAFAVLAEEAKSAVLARSHLGVLPCAS